MTVGQPYIGMPLAECLHVKHFKHDHWRFLVSASYSFEKGSARATYG